MSTASAAAEEQPLKVAPSDNTVEAHPKIPSIRDELIHILKDEQLVERVLYVVSFAQVEAINAVQDLFENPPPEMGAAEDLHYHTDQIITMLRDCKVRVGELIT